MLILLDSNIWKSEAGLNSIIGSTLRFFAKKNNAKIILPEVVSLETISILNSDLKRYRDDIKSNHHHLLSMFGTLKEVVLPTDAEIDQKVRGIFSSLGVEIIEVPFSFESAKQSLFKIIQKLPPSEKAEEFCDGVIWNDGIQFLNQDNVSFVTQDKAFYKDREYRYGLAINLKEEINKYPFSLRLYSNLSDLVSELKSDFKLDDNLLISKITTYFSEEINIITSANNVGISDIANSKIDNFITENANILYFEFNIIFSCSELSQDGRYDISLMLSGEGTFDHVNENLVSARLKIKRLSFKQSDGTDKTINNYYLSANAVLGHRDDRYSLREKV